jgi:hypothetical protein
MGTKNYSKMTETQKTNITSLDKKHKGDLMFESSEDFEEWMERVTNNVQEKQDKENGIK